MKVVDIYVKHLPIISISIIWFLFSLIVLPTPVWIISIASLLIGILFGLKLVKEKIITFEENT